MSVLAEPLHSESPWLGRSNRTRTTADRDELSPGAVDPLVPPRPVRCPDRRRCGGLPDGDDAGRRDRWLLDREYRRGRSTPPSSPPSRSRRPAERTRPTTASVASGRSTTATRSPGLSHRPAGGYVGVSHHRVSPSPSGRGPGGPTSIRYRPNTSPKDASTGGSPAITWFTASTGRLGPTLCSLRSRRIHAKPDAVHSAGETRATARLSLTVA